MNSAGINTYDQLVSEAKSCTICASFLPLGANPIFQAAPSAKIAVVGQAPGVRAHTTNKPFNDPSGIRLRYWMGIPDEVFYDPDKIAIVPMGFCYSGKAKGGDLPPRKECAPAWHFRFWQQLPNVALVLLVGKYAQKYYLGSRQYKTLTLTVQNYHKYLPRFFPLVHPSPRNIGWLRNNSWFETELIPELQIKIQSILK